MQILQYDVLRLSENARSYQVFKAANKIAKLLIDGDGTRTITPQPGRRLLAAERRGIEAFRPSM